MNALCTLALLIVGVIHLLPLAGVLGAERLAALYGVSLSDPNLVVLMRHRAVLFGLLGVFFCISAFRVDYQWLAIAAGLVSTLSFVLIAVSVPNVNAELSKVVWVDCVAVVALLVAAITRWMA